MPVAVCGPSHFECNIPGRTLASQGLRGWGRHCRVVHTWTNLLPALKITVLAAGSKKCIVIVLHIPHEPFKFIFSPTIFLCEHINTSDALVCAWILSYHEAGKFLESFLSNQERLLQKHKTTETICVNSKNWEACKKISRSQDNYCTHVDLEENVKDNEG